MYKDADVVMNEITKFEVGSRRRGVNHDDHKERARPIHRSAIRRPSQAMGNIRRRQVLATMV